MTLRYEDVRVYTQGEKGPPATGLWGLGYGPPEKPMPTLNPGPATLDRLHKISPQAMVFLTVGNGAGLTVETLYDRVFITARVIGVQNNFDYAETLAFDIDNLLLDAVNGVRIGGARTLYVTRTGGAPQLVNFDAADRYHFQATYLTEVKR